MPWPISPAPTTATRVLASSTRRVTAIGIENVSGIEIGSLRGEEQERAGKIGRLAKATLRHARQEAFAHRRRALVVLVHPCGERRAEHRRPNGIHRDVGVAPFATER